MQKGFVYLDEAVPDLKWDAKYATSDNFTGAIVDGYRENRVVGTAELAQALIKAAQRARGAGLGLFVWDAYRPQRAVDCFVRWSQMPEDFRTKAAYYPHIERADMLKLGYIAVKSGHSRGGAVDLTLYQLDTLEQLEMGGHFDLMDDLSHHGATGISEKATSSRALLRGWMLESGFKDYRNEWWHYTLANEPYPDTCFDFPIGEG